MLTVLPTTKLWFAPDIDLRLGFDGLANLVRSQLQADPLSGHLFVFTNRSANRVKVLYWGGHGLCLWCQRLEAGHYHFPEATASGIELTAAQFAMILDGIDLSRPTIQTILPAPIRKSHYLVTECVLNGAWMPPLFLWTIRC